MIDRVQWVQDATDLAAQAEARSQPIEAERWRRVAACRAAYCRALAEASAAVARCRELVA